MRRERNLETERVLEAIRVGAIEPRTLVNIIDRPVSSVFQASAPVNGVAPIPFNDPDGGDDLIAKWAKWPGKRGKPPGAKTVYEARRMIRKPSGFVGFDDLARLTRQNVEDWIELLMETEVAPGEKMAPKTVEQHLIQLKALANFAVDKAIISVNPAGKVRFSARVRTKIRAFTNAEARVVLEAARHETTDYKRWLPWICCFTGCRLDEPAGAAVPDIERVGSYWVLNVRLDHRHEGASIKNDSSVRRVPLHPKLWGRARLCPKPVRERAVVPVATARQVRLEGWQRYETDRPDRARAGRCHAIARRQTLIAEPLMATPVDRGMPSDSYPPGH